MFLLEVSLAARYALYIWILWRVSIFTYRLTFHPLRKYPGPFLARLTNAYSWFFAIQKQLHINVYKNLQKYGPIYREAPNRLVFNTITAIKDIYSHPHIIKGESFRHSPWLQSSSLFYEAEKDKFQWKRKLFAQVLSSRSLRGFYPTMDAQINIYLRLLLRSSQKSEVVDMTVRCKQLATDIVGYLAFGYALNTQTEPTNRFIIRGMSKAIFTGFIAIVWPVFRAFFPISRWLRELGPHTARNAMMKMIRSRMEQPKDARPDFYSHAAGQFDADKENPLRSELWTEAYFFAQAGGTTVATAMSSVFFYLSRNADAYARLTAEIREAFSSGRDICNGPDLLGCKYLRAVLDESMRIAGPSMITLWRQPEESSTEPFIVDGHVIPPGIEVGINMYGISHNADYFPNPYAFKPERRLGPNDGGAPNSPEQDEIRAKMRAAQVYFGLGDRGCIGKDMAYMETSLVIARTLWYFDFVVAPGEAGKLGAGKEGSRDPWAKPDQFQLLDILIAEHDGPNLVFKARGEHWRELEMEEKRYQD
ncbi:Cytochrome P450 monooxygenase AKT7 [Cladobotryum mycophilum]|uniref:Cytochrome P450 monooxygenase AKT7 n=1 Tax=Cladobotryum mycophilum TaxID=491253 RepID=A0ABR0SSG0_9HYPO